MAGSLNAFSAGFLTPAPSQVTLSNNYLSAEDFDFISQYLPDTQAQEFERYGPRTVSGFLQLTGSESPTNSDLIKWAEQGRLHQKYEGLTQDNSNFSSNAYDTFDIASGTCNLRIGQTVHLSSLSAGDDRKAIVISVGANSDYAGTTATSFVVAYYSTDSGTSPFASATDVKVFVYGTEYAKGTDGMQVALEAEKDVYEVKPIIIKDMYQVAGSDMAQIGWIETVTEEGTTGYYWFLKSSSETRLRFNDYMEMAMIEGVPAADTSGAEAYLVPDAGASSQTKAGTDGLFYSVEQRGNVWAGGNPTTMADFDTILTRLDKQGQVEENILFLDRDFCLDIDDMLAAQNSYGAGGTSYGVFQNSEDMALNLGFDGFKRGGYEFYKTDWKYLNDPTLRGGLDQGGVSGVLVPAGQTTVYDQVLGQNARRPFLHVRYRASEHEDRRYKSWVTGSAGGARTSTIDKMQIDFLTERALCTLGANNFFIFND